jgi:hypothetical protein
MGLLKQKKARRCEPLELRRHRQRRVRETLLLPNNKTKNYEKLIKLLKQLMNVMD